MERAQAFADAYLDFRTERFERVTSNQTERIEDQVDNQRELLASLADRAEAATNTAERSLLETRVRGVAAQIGQLRGQLAELQTDAVDPGQVITPADAVGQSALRVRCGVRSRGNACRTRFSPSRSSSCERGPRTGSTAPRTSSPRACPCSAASR